MGRVRAFLAFRGVDQGRDVPAHEIVGFRVPDSALQREMPHGHGCAGVLGGHVGQCLPHVGCRHLAKPPATYNSQDRLKHILVLLDRLRRAAVKPFLQPVLCSLAYGVSGVASLRSDPCVQVGVQDPQLVLDGGSGQARDLPPYAALAVRGVPEGNGTTPYARAAIVPSRVAARTSTVLKVDRVLAPSAAPGHDMRLPSGAKEWGHSQQTAGLLQAHADTNKHVKGL
jgi:hypothetical protein